LFHWHLKFYKLMKTVNKKYKIRTGDTVKVIAGNGKGKSGKVLNLITEKDRVVVEGINVVSKHVKPSASSPNGGIEKQEAGIHISNVMVVDPKSGEPSRVGRKANSKGELERFSKKTGNVI